MKKRKLTPLDGDELVALIDRYYGVLVLYAGRFCPGAAEDLAQSAFAKLIETAGYRGKPESPGAWLFRVVRNEGLDMIKRRTRERHYQKSLAAVGAEKIIEQSKPIEHDERIADALAELNDADRQIVTLRIWGGLSFAEIAETLNEPKTSLFRRYETALGGMKKSMERES